MGVVVELPVLPLGPPVGRAGGESPHPPQPHPQRLRGPQNARKTRQGAIIKGVVYPEVYYTFCIPLPPELPPVF